VSVSLSEGSNPPPIDLPAAMAFGQSASR
jgi:hypothetical protein